MARDGIDRRAAAHEAGTRLIGDVRRITVAQHIEHKQARDDDGRFHRADLDQGPRAPLAPPPENPNKAINDSLRRAAGVFVDEETGV
jgi:hypothetical protein